jgi:hypothetical protein
MNSNRLILKLCKVDLKKRRPVTYETPDGEQLLHIYLHIFDDFFSKL